LSPDALAYRVWKDRQRGRAAPIFQEKAWDWSLQGKAKWNSAEADKAKLCALPASNNPFPSFDNCGRKY
jgi:hypothetical protein